MGVFNTEAKKAFMETKYLFETTDNCFLTSMFYGHAQVLVNAKDLSEAEKFEKLARQDFEVFTRSKPEEGAPFDVKTESFDHIIMNYSEDGTTFIAMKEMTDGGYTYISEVDIKDNVVVRKASNIVNSVKDKVKDKFGKKSDDKEEVEETYVDSADDTSEFKTEDEEAREGKVDSEV